jgi:hypothetical protein
VQRFDVCNGDADRLCAAFDHLPAAELPGFVQAFAACRWGR